MLIFIYKLVYLLYWIWKMVFHSLSNPNYIQPLYYSLGCHIYSQDSSIYMLFLSHRNDTFHKIQIILLTLGFNLLSPFTETNNRCIVVLTTGLQSYDVLLLLTKKNLQNTALILSGCSVDHLPEQHTGESIPF